MLLVLVAQTDAGDDTGAAAKSPICNIDECGEAYWRAAACRRSPLCLGATSAIPDPTLAAELLRASAAAGQQA
jgi:hypothetical protein